MAIEYLLVTYPEQRAVLADGNGVGFTNHTLMLPTDEYLITLEGDGYDPPSQDIALACRAASPASGRWGFRRAQASAILAFNWLCVRGSAISPGWGKRHAICCNVPIGFAAPYGYWL